MCKSHYHSQNRAPCFSIRVAFYVYDLDKCPQPILAMIFLSPVIFLIVLLRTKKERKKSRTQDTAVQLVYNPFSQFVSQLELYSQLQLSLQSDPIALGVPIST